MNNVNMGGMNAMGGPVGGGMPMMNNGGAPGVRPPMQGSLDQRSQLNTYIYEYFLRNGMYDCARSLYKSGQPVNTMKEDRDSNGAGDEGGDGDSKDDIDSQRPSDLPDPNLPKECPESCFLFEWWCLFWDMFNAQRGKGEGPNILRYVSHTQAQSRVRQDQQQAMLQGLRNNMVPNNPRYATMMMNNQNGMGELRQKAIQNQRNATPQQLQMIAQQQKMQRDPSDGNGQQRTQSPGPAENAPSPSKRPRLDGTPFNPQQMVNGRGQVGGVPQQFQNMPGANQQARISGYQANLIQQQQGQMASVKPMQNAGGPQNQGSPMMTQGGAPDSGAIANYYNPGQIGPNGLRSEPGGPAGGGGNHALQDYQMQLMLLEQQNKKRLMMARQEQDNMMPRSGDGSGGPGGGPGPVGPNGQPFQQGTSPQGPRSVNSPNPVEQIKRGTPHMNPAGMPSPLPEGSQNRGSPSGSMNFNMQGGQMDPNMNPQYFKMTNGMDPNMVANMRPPSSHPGGGFNPQMTPQQQQMVIARQQQAQQAQQQHQQAAAVQNWQQAGPNGQMMQQQAQGGPPQQAMGTPQQRAMPPPPAVAAGPTTNGRTQPPSPQQNPAQPPTPSQANKANPKKKNETKDSKAKRAAKKGSAANLNATPSADADNAGATPTPATPITPIHPKSFNNGQNGAVQPVTNGQPAAPAANPSAVPQQPDPLQSGNFGLGDTYDFQGGMDFANPSNGNMDVLQDFDFDSFLHADGEGVSDFTFDNAAFMDGGEIGAE